MTIKPSPKITVRDARQNQRGNVFFTLFAAVALVGILGAGVMSTMRGPLSTMVEVNRRAQADSEMAIASRLTLLEATDTLANDGDCDSDGFVEALEPKSAGAADKPVGGGFLPDAVGSKKEDPWGTMYGYCAWDAGPVTANVGCDDGDAGTIARLNGTGDSVQTYTVIAIVSAGPNTTFETTCTGGATPSVTRAADSDDVIVEFTYETATAASGGLWNIKSGDPSTAEIDKDLEVSGAAKFKEGIDLSDAGFGASAQLKLGAASMLLPTEGTLITCSLANKNLVRINTTTDPDTLQICDDASDAGTGAFTWQNVAAGASSVWTVAAADIIHRGISTSSEKVGINKNNPAEALDITGNIALTGDVKVATGKGIDWSALTHKIIAAATGITANIGGTDRAKFLSTGNELLHDTKITGSTNDNTKAALTVESADGTDVVFVRNDGKVGIGESNPSVALDVSGTANTSDGYMIGGNLVVNNNGINRTILLGVLAGENVTGNYNTILGAYDAAATLTSGESNIIIGFEADVPSATTSNYLNIGNLLHGDLDNKRLGVGFADNSAVSGYDDTLEVNGMIGATSDIKTDRDVLATRDVKGADVYASSQVFVNNVQFGPPAECDIDEKLQWDDATGWSCVADQDGSGSGGGNVTSIFEKSGTVVRPTSVVAISTDDFVFGSQTLDDDGVNTSEDDKRMFFDKSKAAFRAGIGADADTKFDETSDVWDSVNVGNYSAAFGYHNKASGIGSFAAGEASTASGNYSMAFGSESISSGQSSVALGETPTAAGRAAVALGFSTHAGSYAETSLGMFSLNIAGTAGSSVLTDTLFEIGNGTSAAARANALTLLKNGNMGLGDASPDSGTGGQLKLDVEGPVGATKYCDEAGNNCFESTDVSGGSSVFEITGNVVRPVSGTVTISTDDFVFGSLTLDDDGILGSYDDTRMFFDKSKGAFRAGSGADFDGDYDSGFNRWDTANVGVYSFASGYYTRASSAYSTAMGANTTASGSHSTAIGANTTASGSYSTAMGVGTTASGNNSTAMGVGTTASGAFSTAIGQDISASGLNALALGKAVLAGDGTGRSSFTTGQGGGSFAVGLQTASQATHPRITGDRSMVLFFDGNTSDANSTYNFTANDKFALIGGEFQIDDVSSSANKGCIKYNSGTTKLQFSHDCSTYADIGDASSSSSIFEKSGIVIRPVSGTVTLSTDDFVFGSLQLTDSGDANNDSRMFFDKSLGAFRAGTVTGTQWDAPGQQSVAFGINTTASGNYSAAIGSSTTASGLSSNAMGFSSTASGSYSTAIGITSVASGDFSTAIGTSAIASGIFSAAIGKEVLAGDGTGRTSFTTGQGGGSFAVGLQTANQTTDPRITGDRSMVLFFDANTVDRNSAYNFTANDKFALIGGEFQIDDVSSSANKGCIKYNSGTTKLQFSHDCSTYADIGSGTGSGTSVFTRSGTVVMPDSSVVTTSTDDFVFGSLQLTDSGDANNDSRMFFDKSQGAFRAGTVTGTEWDAPGLNSVAFGLDTTAAGASSTASGLGTHAGSYAETSLGLYSLSTAGTVGSSVLTDTLFEIGNGTGTGARANALTVLKNGDIGIGDATPNSGTGGQLKLDVEGAVGATKYCDEDGDNCFAPTAISGSIYTLTDGATIAVDWANGAQQMVTLGGNRTFTFTGGLSGQRYTLIIKQDGTGSRTVTWPGTARFPGGTAPTLTSTASKTDYIGFFYNSVDSTYDALAISQNY